ncbi:hypothetical protein NTPn39_08270 [Streptococcus pneumoniae]|nr:hypothetical protein NTPn39_08270 [Streptococcus pneumoniae]
MKKIIKKIVVCFCIVILLFTSAFKPKEVKADAGAGLLSGGGMLLGTLNPAVLPWVVLGIVACVAVGYAIENWDEVTAVGGAVADELKKMGHSVSDFVSGTSVKVDDTLKQAIKNVTGSMGETISRPVSDRGITYSNGVGFLLGRVTPSEQLPHFLAREGIYLGDSSKGLRYKEHQIPGHKNFMPRSYDLSSVTLVVDITPIPSDKAPNIAFVSLLDKSVSEVKRVFNDAGDVIQLTRTVSSSDKLLPLGAAIFTEKKRTNDFYIKGVSIPELGISVGEKIKTDTLKRTEIQKEVVTKYIDTAFPKNSETVTFKSDAQVASLSLPALPRVSDKTYSDDQLRELNKIRAGTGVATPAVPEVGAGSLGIGEIPGTGSLTGAGELAGAGTLAGSGATTAAGTGLGWLDKIIEWLKKLLNAILGIPGAILNGLKALWDWLAKILQAILAIPGGIINILSKIWEFLQTLSKVISDAITGAITWTFSIDETWLRGRLSSLNDTFRRKFPVMVPLRYDFNDKDTISDMSVNIFGSNYVILNGATATKLASPIKMVFRALAYVLMALFFARKFHKVAED